MPVETTAPAPAPPAPAWEPLVDLYPRTHFRPDLALTVLRPEDLETTARVMGLLRILAYQQRAQGSLGRTAWVFTDALDFMVGALAPELRDRVRIAAWCDSSLAAFQAAGAPGVDEDEPAA